MNEQFKYQFASQSNLLDKADQICDDIKECLEDSKKMISSKIDNQTKILNEIRLDHPAEKLPESKIGKFLQKITRLESVAVFIAILQVFIAFPQLQVAYHSLTHTDTIDELNDAFNSFMNHTESLAIVNIPDSLITPDIVKIRTIQNELFINLKVISQCEILKKIDDIDTLNLEEVKTICANNLLKCMELSRLLERINSIEKSLINEHYFSSLNIDLDDSFSLDIDDSFSLEKLSNFEKILLLYIPMESILEIIHIQGKVNKGLENYNLFLEKNTQEMDPKKFYNDFIKKMPFSDFVELIRAQDSVGVAFINALNHVQYCMAYNISLN